MGKAKVGMELISNKRKRQTTFEKRKQGLEKKAHELSTLCGTKVGVIMYGQDDQTKPTIWPENAEEIRSLINSYKKENIDDRKPRTSDLSSLYEEEIKKAKKELTKLHKKNLEAKYPPWDDRLNHLSAENLQRFSNNLEEKIEAAKARVCFLKGQQTHFDESGLGNSSFVDAWNNITNANSTIPQENPCTIQRLIRRSSSQLEIIQPSFNHPPQYSVDVPTISAREYIPMGPTGYAGEEGSVEHYYYVPPMHPMPPKYGVDVPMVSARHYAPVDPTGYAGDGGNVEHYCYVPPVQPVPLCVPYPLQSRSSLQMMHAASQTEDYYVRGQFQFLDQN